MSTNGVPFPYEYVQKKYRGVCLSGCGAEIRRLILYRAPDANDMFWCRRCNAYCLFRWDAEPIQETSFSSSAWYN